MATPPRPPASGESLLSWAQSVYRYLLAAKPRAGVGLVSAESSSGVVFSVGRQPRGGGGAADDKYPFYEQLQKEDGVYLRGGVLYSPEGVVTVEDILLAALGADGVANVPGEDEVRWHWLVVRYEAKVVEGVVIAGGRVVAVEFGQGVELPSLREVASVDDPEVEVAISLGCWRGGVFEPDMRGNLTLSCCNGAVGYALDYAGLPSDG